MAETLAEKVFTYREGYRARVPASVTGPELLRIAGNRGVEGLQAEEVVEAARSRRSPLNAAIWFENDSEAAQARRLGLARDLLGAIRIDVTYSKDESRSVPVLVRPFTNLKDGAGYRDSVAVQNDDELRSQRLQLALGDVQSARRRLAEVREFGEVVEQLAAIERRIRASIR